MSDPTHDLFQLGEMSACRTNVLSAMSLHCSSIHRIDRTAFHSPRDVKLDHILEAAGSRSHSSEQISKECLVAAPRFDLEADLRERRSHFYDDVLVQVF